MANRIVGNVIIIDSAMGNSLVLGTGIVNLDELQINAIGFWSADTTANITLTEANTATDLVFLNDWLSGPSGNTNYQFFPFGNPQKVGNLKVPRLTAGTGFIYLI